MPEFVFQSDPKPDAKGRNGHFVPRTADIVFHAEYADIAIWSRRGDGAPPIWLDLPPAEMLRFGQFIVDVAKGVA